MREDHHESSDRILMSYFQEGISLKTAVTKLFANYEFTRFYFALVTLLEIAKEDTDYSTRNEVHKILNFINELHNNAKRQGSLSEHDQHNH